MNRISTKPKLSERFDRFVEEHPILAAIVFLLLPFMLIGLAEPLAMVLESIWMVIQ